MTDVSSWFIDQLNNRASEPKRFFTMAGSDHSSRVKKWPSIARNIEEITPVNINIDLSNVDGAYNPLYEQSYTMIASCHLDIGFEYSYETVLEKVERNGDVFKRDSSTLAWNAQAYSTEHYINGASISFQIDQTNKDVMVGLDSNPSEDSHYENIDYAIYGAYDNILWAVESNNFIVLSASYTISTKLEVVYTGSQIIYYVDDVALRTVSAAASLDLYMDSSFHNPDVQISNVKFSPGRGGGELLRVYTGTVNRITYSQNICQTHIRDKIYPLSKIKVGSTEDEVDFSSQIPSEIAWTLCTCYGELSDVKSTSNIDIDYELFSAWAATFSADAVVATGNFQGKKINEALKEVVDQTDSFHWVDGDGKLVFQRFTEASSLDFLVDEGQYKKFKLLVDAENLINKQYVSYNYSVASDYWQHQAFAVNSVSVNSFRLHEKVSESENIWYTDSNHATNLGSRIISRLSTPPKVFEIDLPLTSLHREPGNTLRLVNSFYNVSSSSGWRLSQHTLNLQDFSINVRTNEALIANAFFLDVSFLDGDDLLL